MANMNIRGLDDQALTPLKNQAEQEGSSPNSSGGSIRFYATSSNIFIMTLVVNGYVGR